MPKIVLYPEHDSPEFTAVYCSNCRFAETCENEVSAAEGEPIEEWQIDADGLPTCTAFEAFTLEDLTAEQQRSADMCGQRWLDTGSPWPPANDNPDLAAEPAQKKAAAPKTKSRPAPTSRPSKGRPWVQLPLPLRRNGKPLPQPKPTTAKEA